MRRWFVVALLLVAVGCQSTAATPAQSPDPDSLPAVTPPPFRANGDKVWVAGVLDFGTPGELADESEFVVRGTVLTVSGEFPMMGIMPAGYEHTYTYSHGVYREITIDVSRAYLGALDPANHLTIRHLSRILCCVHGDAEHRPTWTPGEEVILFLHHDQYPWFPGYTPYEDGQGKWVVDSLNGTVRMSIDESGTTEMPLSDAEAQILA